MTSKKSLKKKIKKLKKKLEFMQDTSIGIMFFMMRMASTWDKNMDLIQKTFDMVARKVNELEDRTNPLNILEPEPQPGNEGKGNE